MEDVGQCAKHDGHWAAVQVDCARDTVDNAQNAGPYKINPAQYWNDPDTTDQIQITLITVGSAGKSEKAILASYPRIRLINTLTIDQHLMPWALTSLLLMM